jgi:hypothetical protein
MSDADGDGDGGFNSAAPVNVSRPPAINDTPIALRIAGARRLRSVLLSLPTRPES